MSTASIEDIDKLLPQTQCRECGYDGCLPYATALKQGIESIDKCAPGGTETLQALATLLDKDPTPYVDTVLEQYRPPAMARIIEPDCIGCTKCIQACPVDAIIGSSKQMHQIIEQECTGCGLCVEPCPVDCIELTPQASDSFIPLIAKNRFDARALRLQQQAEEKKRVYRQAVSTKQTSSKAPASKQDYIRQALARKMKISS